jgi:hypothetical protein
MRIRNTRGFPQIIVGAVENDPYSAGGSWRTATELNDSPQIAMLRRQYDDQIVEDVEDRIWALVGQVGHAIIERAAKPGSDIVEQRLYADVFGKRIGGMVDHINGKTIIDWKFTSVWATREGPRSEWVKQANIYRWLAHKNGYEINELRIIAIYRDWSKYQARTEWEYPQKQIEIFPVPLWSLENVTAYVEGRVRLHLAAEAGDVPECTREERWVRDDKWAVVGEGAKRALRVFDNEAEARALANNKNDNPPKQKSKWAGPYDVEFRPGVAVRCEDYCSVAPRRRRI